LSNQKPNITSHNQLSIHQISQSIELIKLLAAQNTGLQNKANKRAQQEKNTNHLF